ncbi:MAG: hypothetical protein EA396_00150 [Anaerolineaceae bacterium]|nr:MAG: hypothetical protein EA396_00150 [Anaerolineaceae bacterium]
MGLIFLLLWSLFAWQALEAVRKGFLDNRGRLSVWLQMLLALLVFSLNGEAREQRLDAHFNDWPLAFYLKYFGMVLWFYLYYRLIRDVLRRVSYIDTVFYAVFVIGVLSIPSMLLVEERTLRRHVMVGVRDFFLLIPALTLFIPGTRLLAEREHVVGMKAKQQWIVFCYSVYSMIAVGNVIKAGLVFIDVDAIVTLERVFTPLLFPAAVAFFFLLLPNRWLLMLHTPLRLYQYWRLYRLERYVLKSVGATEHARRPSLALVRMSELELAIYRATINILDYGLLLEHDPRCRRLYAEIQEAGQLDDSYGLLVKRLAKVRLSSGWLLRG